MIGRNSLFGPLDPAPDAGYEAPPPRKGFFTDTSVCIGCKACEVACKEWNDVPENLFQMLGTSYDNSHSLNANQWRHVAFIERPGRSTTPDQPDRIADPATPPVDIGMPTVGAPPSGVPDEAKPDFQWLMSSDVCKHCTHAACLDVCPTESIVYGDVEQLRQQANERVAALHEQGVMDARLYGNDPEDGVGGTGAFFLLLDEPEVYGLPPDPVVTTKDLPHMFTRAGMAGTALLIGAALSFVRRRS
jgi:Fe-S-cluster-containing dehydrogenase component